MIKADWLKLIEEKETEIIELGKQAYREAINNKHLRFIVEMNENGEIYSWYDVAGGNSYHMSVHEGTAIELFQFCFQCSDLEITEDDIINKLNEKGYQSRIKELQEEAEKENTCLENIIIENYRDELYSVIIEECYKDAIDFEVEELAPQVIEDKLGSLKYTLSNELIFK